MAKFDKIVINASVGTICNPESNHVVFSSNEKECLMCKELTHWRDWEAENAPICSEECHKALYE